MKKLAILFIVLLTIASCKKEEEGTPIWRIWYAVQLTPEFDMDIVYNSDKFAASGEIDTIKITDKNFTPNIQDNTWIAQHLQKDKSLGYKINLKINSTTPYQGRLGVFVYANDTSLLDSITFLYGEKSINLEGTIPKTFD